MSLSGMSEAFTGLGRQEIQMRALGHGREITAAVDTALQLLCEACTPRAAAILPRRSYYASIAGGTAFFIHALTWPGVSYRLLADIQAGHRFLSFRALRTWLHSDGYERP